MISIREKVVFLVESLHFNLFGHKMSDEMRDFLKNLSWTFFGGIGAAGIMFLVNVLAGRFLGPIRYGNYNYILSIASSWTFFFLLGNNQTSIRYISDKTYHNRKGSILSALLFLTILQSLVFLLAVVVFHSFIENRFNITNSIVYLIFLFGLIFSLKELFDSFIRSFGLFKKQSFIKIADALAVFLVFLTSFFFFRKNFSHLSYLYSMSAGAIITILSALYLIRRNFRKFENKDFKLIFSYNKFLILGGLIGFIISLEKVFIGKYIGIERLGIYSAYYSSSQLISTFSILFANTFWPTAVKNRDAIGSVIEKLNKVFFKYFPLWFVLNILCISFFVVLYGGQYPFYFKYVLLFSASSLLNFIFSVFMSLMNIEKIKIAIFINAIIYILFIGSIIIFKNISLYLIFQTIVYFFGIIFVRKYLKAK